MKGAANAVTQPSFHQSSAVGPVVAMRQLLAMIRGWGRWYHVESVSIEWLGAKRQLLS